MSWSNIVEQIELNKEVGVRGKQVLNPNKRLYG